MFINLLAFTLGVVFWTVVVCAHPKIIAFLPKIFDKVLPKFSSLMLSYVLALFFYAILFMSPRYYKFFVLEQDWRQFSKLYFLGILFALCGYQFLQYLSERKKK